MTIFSKEPTVITEQPFGSGDDNTAMITRGYILRLTCKAVGLPPPTYQWYLNHEPIEGQTESDLVQFNFEYVAPEFFIIFIFIFVLLAKNTKENISVS